MTQSMDNLEDKQCLLQRLISAFELKIEASAKTCSSHTLQQMLMKLKERPTARGRGKISSLRALKEVVEDERERTLMDFTLSYKPDPVLKYFQWYLEFLDYLRELKQNFDSKIYTPLRTYFLDKKLLTPARTVSRSSVVSVRSVEMSFGPGVNVLQLSRDSGIHSNHSNHGVVAENLKAEFKELEEIYQNSETIQCSNEMERLNQSWDDLLNEERELTASILDTEFKLNSQDLRDAKSTRDITLLVQLVPKILLESQKSAQTATDWLAGYKTRTRNLNEKFQKITDVQLKMSSKLLHLHQDIDKKEGQLKTSVDKLEKLFKKEDRADDIRGQLFEINKKEEVIKELLDIANKQRHEIATQMLDPSGFDKKSLDALRFQYEENKLKRYILERKLKAMDYSKEVLTNDLDLEMEVKPSIIRFTNDAQERCETLEESIDKSMKLKRSIEQVLGPLQEDKELLEEELKVSNGNKLTDDSRFSMFTTSSHSLSTVSSPGSTTNHNTDIPTTEIEMQPIIEEISELCDNQKETKPVDLDHDRKICALQIVEVVSDESIPPPHKKQPKKKEQTETKPPWQHTYKPTTVGKQKVTSDPVIIKSPRKKIPQSKAKTLLHGTTAQDSQKTKQVKEHAIASVKEHAGTDNSMQVITTEGEPLKTKTNEPRRDTLSEKGQNNKAEVMVKITTATEDGNQVATMRNKLPKPAIKKANDSLQKQEASPIKALTRLDSLEKVELPGKSQKEKKDISTNQSHVKDNRKPLNDRKGIVNQRLHDKNDVSKGDTVLPWQTASDQNASSSRLEVPKPKETNEIGMSQQNQQKLLTPHTGHTSQGIPQSTEPSPLSYSAIWNEDMPRAPPARNFASIPKYKSEFLAYGIIPESGSAVVDTLPKQHAQDVVKPQKKQIGPKLYKFQSGSVLYDSETEEILEWNDTLETGQTQEEGAKHSQNKTKVRFNDQVDVLPTTVFDGNTVNKRTTEGAKLGTIDEDRRVQSLSKSMTVGNANPNAPTKVDGKVTKHLPWYQQQHVVL